MEELLDALDRRLAPALVDLELLVPHERGDVVASLHRCGEVLAEAHEPAGVHLEARLPAAEAAAFLAYSV
jgi:GTP-binding protein HflX